MAYKMTHPDSDQEIQVEKEQVQLYVDQGWQTKPNVKPPAVEGDGK